MIVGKKEHKECNYFSLFHENYSFYKHLYLGNDTIVCQLDFDNKLYNYLDENNLIKIIIFYYILFFKFKLIIPISS